MKNTMFKKMMLIGLLLFIFSSPAISRGQTMDDKSKDVGVSEAEGIGAYLTDVEGMTLYYFTKDSPNKSVCTGFCLDRWPLFQVEVEQVPENVAKDDFAMITRDDGKKQTVYKEKPLYYFLGDKEPGDIKGQGVNDSWYIISP